MGDVRGAVSEVRERDVGMGEEGAVGLISPGRGGIVGSLAAKARDPR